jgi:hypothetical protein
MQIQSYYLTLQAPDGQQKDAWVHTMGSGADPIAWADKKHFPWVVVDASAVEWKETT